MGNANTQRAVSKPAWGVSSAPVNTRVHAPAIPLAKLPVPLSAKPKATPATLPFQNPDRLRQWGKDAQAQTRFQRQQPTVPAEANASNARTADALSKTHDVSAITR